MTPPAAGSVGLFKSPSERQPSCLPEHLWPPTVRPPKTLRHTWERRHLPTDTLERGRSRPTFPHHSVREPLRSLAEHLRQNVEHYAWPSVPGQRPTWSGAPLFLAFSFFIVLPIAPLPASRGRITSVSTAKGVSALLLLSFSSGALGFRMSFFVEAWHL